MDNPPSDKKKVRCKSSQIFIYVLLILAGFSHRKKMMKKLGSQNLRDFTQKLFRNSLTSNIVVRCSSYVKKNILRLWTMYGRPLYTTAGHFFKNSQKFWQKSSKMRASINKYGPYFVPCGCESYKNYMRHILYTHTNFLQ